MAEDIAISVQGVYKDFHYNSNRNSSIKGVLTNIFKNEANEKDIQHALRDISFEVKKGEFFGIVGRNGSGKSTLLKIIAGIYQPNKGIVQINGKLVPFIELGVGFNPELTGRENVYLNGALLGFNKKQINSMYDEIVEFAELDLFMEQKLKNYSSGMQVRLAFSMAVRAQADILLVDEVLAVGDAEFQKKCFNYFKQLKKNKTTVILVTHDMNAVREFCERAILIEDSRILSSGRPNSIANKYGDLFIESKKRIASKGVDRWGTGEVEFIKSKAKVVGDNLIITARAIVNQDVDLLLFGLHIVSPDGNDLVAVNNRYINAEDIKSPKKGDVITFNWEMLNILSDGEYTVSLTLTDQIATVYDWYTDICSFSVSKKERSATSILPPLSVTTIINNNNNNNNSK
ncbi:MAG: ABC transporter ATP-binding protein [Candidatus Saccharibacteria bacterium]|nr:ABC transporter ATP-binding protein [Candidatus Saccharibacteria bacterium]